MPGEVRALGMTSQTARPLPPSSPQGSHVLSPQTQPSCGCPRWDPR